MALSNFQVDCVINSVFVFAGAGLSSLPQDEIKKLRARQTVETGNSIFIHNGLLRKIKTLFNDFKVLLPENSAENPTGHHPGRYFAKCKFVFCDPKKFPC